MKPINISQQSNRKIWVLEDDDSCRFVYSQILGLRYDVQFFARIDSLLKAFDEAPTLPSLAIFDIMVPDGCFLQVLSSPEKSRSLRKIPFIVVSSVDDLDALRHCYDEGATEYLTKPFGRAELTVKIERIFSEMDVKEKEGQANCSELTPKEKTILSLFLKSKTREVSRSQLVREVWQDTVVNPKTLDVHIYNLRKKLENQGFEIECSGPQKWILLGNRVQ